MATITYFLRLWRRLHVLTVDLDLKTLLQKAMSSILALWSSWKCFAKVNTKF